jgi:hypothetical protein
MKRLTFLLVLLLAPVTAVHADQPKTIAVIDSGVNTALFTNIVTEVCILEYSNCANGKPFMEGNGAANTGVTTNATLNHGTEMLSIINKVNPSVGLIPIRIVGITDKGNPYIYSNNAVKLGLDWVVANRVKYNIVAVNVSQGKIFDGCKVPDGTAQDVAILKANNVAVIAASGNDSNRTAMHSIACLPDVISVGATDNPDPTAQGRAYDSTAKPYIARYSNGNTQTSFYLNARWFTLQPNGTTKFMVGTSNSSAAMTGWWVMNMQKSWTDTYNKAVASATAANNEWLSGRYIQLP